MCIIVYVLGEVPVLNLPFIDVFHLTLKKKSLLGLENGSVETCKHKDMNLIPRTHAHICNVSREAETGFVGWLVCTGQWASGQ